MNTVQGNLHRDYGKKLIVLLNDFWFWMLVGVGAVFATVWLVLLRKRLNIAWYAALPITLACAAVAYLGGGVLGFIESGFKPDGFRTSRIFGDIFMVPLAYWVGAKLFKMPLKESFDSGAVCEVLMLMFIRVHCFLAGCCLGLPIPGMLRVRFPTREAEILFDIILLIYLCPRVWKGKTEGRAYPIYMISYGAFRFVTEFLRVAEGTTGTTSLFHIAHLWSLISMIVGTIIYVKMKNGKSRPGKKKRIIFRKHRTKHTPYRLQLGRRR